MVVYDPFIGSGTTACACKNLGLDCIGSEISENQVAFAKDRLGITEEPAPKKDFWWLSALLDGD